MQRIELRPRASSDGVIIRVERGWRMAIPAGSSAHYRLSQLDDQAGRARSSYIWRPPLMLSLRARVSTPATPGTWGFGLWNDPYGFSVGPGDTFFRLPALPQTAWFFAASPRSYLSFRDDKPARGFIAQVFSSGGFQPTLISAAFTLPFSPRRARQLLRRVIHEESVAVAANPSHWHSFQISWTEAGTEFRVDKEQLLNTELSPRAPLGLVAWIDNQYAAFDPRGRLSWGTEENPVEAWLEVEDLRLNGARVMTEGENPGTSAGRDE